MALAIIPTIIVSFVVIVALFGTYYIYHAYKRVRFAVPDVERTSHIENLEHHKQPSIQLHDIEPPDRTYQSGQWYGPENVVPTHVAPVTKALPRISETEYTGGKGLVSPPGRVFSSSKDATGGKRKENGLDEFQTQDLHAGRLWNFATDGYGNSRVDQPGLVSPKPVRTVTRNSPKAEPTNTAYDSAQIAAANIWDKINKGELQPSRRKVEKKMSKSLIATAPERLREPADFENDVLQDIDLRSSTKEWAKAKVSSAYVAKRPSKRDSFDSTITAVDASDVNIERPASYVKRKKSIGTDIIKLPQPLDRAAEARRKILEAKEQMADRKKREAEERQAEERRQAEEQNQRMAEQQKLSEEKKRQENEERARSLAGVTKTEDEDLCNTNGSRSRRPSASRRSNSSTESESARKSRERPLPRSPKRAYTFANDKTSCANDSVAEKKPSSSRSGMSRSMSMNDRKRQDINATMAPIAEGNGNDDTDEGDVDSSEISKVAKPFSDSTARRSDGSKTSASSGCSYKYHNGRRASRDIPENPFTSIQDPKVSLAPTQRSSGSSSIESRSQAQRRSNASSNDSRLSSDSRLSLNHPERNNNKSSAEFRASADSQSSTHSIADRGKPEHKSSFASRTLGKLGRKSSSSEKKEGDPADLMQFDEHDGPRLRGGAIVFAAEPEEMSEPDDEYKDWRHRKGQDEDAVRMRGGAGEKTVESGNESEAGAEKEGDHDAREDAHSDDGHSEDDHSEDEHSEDEPSESDDDIEEHDSSEDEGFEDNASEDEHSESEVSNDEVSDAGTSDYVSGDEGSDNGNEQTLLQTPAKIVSTKTVGMVKA
ncbi:unnamed protein product [Alternaria alternata]